MGFVILELTPMHLGRGAGSLPAGESVTNCPRIDCALVKGALESAVDPGAASVRARSIEIVFPRLGLLAHLLRSLFYSNNGATEVGLKAFGRRVLRPQCFCNGRARPFIDDLAQVGTHRDALDHDAA